MKELHPVEMPEFARARGICDEPAFCWWVPYTLKKRDAIISAVSMVVRKITHKYGIKILTGVEHAKELDRQNNNTMWMDALAREMYNVGVAFEVVDEGQKAPNGWKKVTRHLVWDVKMDLTRKARWVLNGCKMPDPVGSTFTRVVSRESMRIAFTYAVLNRLDILAADIRNAHLQAPSSQRNYIICGPEFGIDNVGHVALIHRVLYGRKSVGKDFWNHLRSCMHHLNCKSCPTNPNVWMQPSKKADRFPCYDYILLYMDDTLVVSENAEQILRGEIGKYFELKEELVGPPKIYLGGHV